jgi:transcriptional regulator with XRE-family HTH domain
MDPREALYKVREDRGLSIRQVCEKTKGISASYLSQIENKKRRLNQPTLEQLLQIYGINREDFGKICDENEPTPEFPSIKSIPVIDMAKGTFDDLWNADDKMFNSSVIKDQVGAGGIGDRRAFVLEVNHPDLADGNAAQIGVAKMGDYLFITPRAKVYSDQVALILIQPTKEILVRTVFFKEPDVIRLVSSDPAIEERIINRKKTQVKIYFIDSIQHKQKRGRKR